MHKHHTLEDTVYFHFAANTTAGTAGDGASPTFVVRKCGAASSAAPTSTGTPTLLSHANYSDGSHEIAVAATAANGFEAAAEYAVFCSLTISSVNPNGFVGSFSLKPIIANAIQIAGTAQTAKDLGAINVTDVNTLASHDPGATLGTSTYGGGDTSGTTTLLTRLSATRAGYLDNLTNLDAAISSLNNLSALINLYGSPLLEIPDSSSTAFAFTLVVRDNEGKLVDLDASPTITAANAAGTDRSANLSAVSHLATGRYTFIYSVASTAAEEPLRITCSGTVSSEGRYIEWVGAVVNYDTLTTLQAIHDRVEILPTTADFENTLYVMSDLRRIDGEPLDSGGNSAASNFFQAFAAAADGIVPARDGEQIGAAVAATPTPTTVGFDAIFTAAPDTGVLNDRTLVTDLGGVALQRCVRPILSYTKISPTVGRFTFDEPFPSAQTAGELVWVKTAHSHPITQIRDSTLDRVLSGNHDTPGTVGKLLQDVAVPGDEMSLTQAILDAIEAIVVAHGGSVNLTQQNIDDIADGVRSKFRRS